VEENGSLKTMIVDDEEDNLSLYKDYLSSKGHQVTSSLTANNIMDEYENTHPDITIIDYKLPGKDGIDAAIELLTKYPSAPILFVTAYDNLNKEILRNHIFENKHIDILLKPVKLIKIETCMFNLVYKDKDSIIPHLRN